jgi:type II restriction enzyme
MNNRCDLRLSRCSESDQLKSIYDAYLKQSNKNFLDAVEDFENIAEGYIRPIFNKMPSMSEKAPRSIDQAWRNCKGALYEYAVCRALDEILTKDPYLASKIDIIHGSKLNVNDNDNVDNIINNIKEQLFLKNWSDIRPDTDFVIINKDCIKVAAVLSCKTSLRERLTETAFWARELKSKDIDVIFITTDKDDEVTKDVNRYIVMHVLDYTIITDPQRYKEIINKLQSSFADKPGFKDKIKKILKFSDIKSLLYEYAKKC